MNYPQGLEALMATTDMASVVDAVMTANDEMIGAQGSELTQSIQNFMMHYHSPMDIRIGALLKNQRALQPKRGDNSVPTPKEIGVVCGWCSQNNSQQRFDHMVIGVPNSYAMLISVVHQKLDDKKLIHTVVGTFTNNDYQAAGTNPSERTQKVSSFKEFKRLLGYLDKVTHEQPIIPIVRDEKKTLSYANKQYEARWVKGDGSLPRPTYPDTTIVTP